MFWEIFNSFFDAKFCVCVCLGGGGFSTAIGITCLVISNKISNVQIPSSANSM